MRRRRLIPRVFTATLSPLTQSTLNGAPFAFGASANWRQEITDDDDIWRKFGRCRGRGGASGPEPIGGPLSEVHLRLISAQPPKALRRGKEGEGVVVEEKDEERTIRMRKAGPGRRERERKVGEGNRKRRRTEKEVEEEKEEEEKYEEEEED